MKGQPIVAVHLETGKLMQIGEVTRTGLKCGCVCYHCGDALEAVLGTPYEKHFRHSNKLNCNPTPESELHLRAKLIIEQNKRLFLPGKGMVDYSDPVIEVSCGDLVPDATITVNGQPVYIEIVVTNPINPPKIGKYKAQKAAVLVIRLADEDREMDEDVLRYMVLEDEEVRHWLPYAEAEVKAPGSESVPWWAWLIGLGAGAVILWDKFGGRGRKRRR